SALTIAASYVVGGFIPLSAYVLIKDVRLALAVSIGVTLLALAVFGAVKSRFTGAPILRGAVQTTLIGGLAAAAAFGLPRLVSRPRPGDSPRQRPGAATPAARKKGELRRGRRLHQ